RLATLLPQIGGDSAFRRDIFEQLERWREYDFEPLISNDHRRIYELLSGNVHVSAGSGNTHSGTRRAPPLNVVEALDWKRAFGIHLAYGIYQDSPIAEAVARY
ncbi:nuclear protein 96, partial [Thamnocephalis sphaerospora]